MAPERDQDRHGSFSQDYTEFHSRADYRDRWSSAFDRRNAGVLWDRIDGVLHQHGGPIGRILEVGCGSGPQLRRMGQRIPGASLAVGIDVRRGPLPEQRRLGLVCVADAAALPFREASFDLIFQILTFSSIADFPKRMAAAAEMQRVLRPGGALIWYDVRLPNPLNPFTSAQTRRSLLRYFPGVSLRMSSMTLIPVLGRRLHPRFPRLARRLEACRFLRSHWFAWFRKPG